MHTFCTKPNVSYSATFIYKLKLCLCMCKVYNRQHLSDILKLYHKNNNIHNDNTRQPSHLNIPSFEYMLFASYCMTNYVSFFTYFSFFFNKPHYCASA